MVREVVEVSPRSRQKKLVGFVKSLFFHRWYASSSQKSKNDRWFWAAGKARGAPDVVWRAAVASDGMSFFLHMLRNGGITMRASRPLV